MNGKEDCNKPSGISPEVKVVSNREVGSILCIVHRVRFDMKICIYKSQGNWNKSSIFLSSLVGIFFSSGSVQNFELTSLKISDHCLIAIFSYKPWLWLLAQDVIFYKNICFLWNKMYTLSLPI